MPPSNDDSEAKQSDPQFKQTAVRDVTARDIQIGQIVQKIVYLGLPFNSHHLRFVQLLANSAYLTCLLGGFMRLWQNGADLTTLLLLIVGSGLLSLTCLYYAWFWQPERQAQKQPAKRRSHQRTRRLAIVGIFAIPLLTLAGFLAWRSLPPPNVLLLVANFANAQNADYRDDRQVTENILRNLGNAIAPYKDVKLQALNQPITEQQGSEAARVAGEQKKAAIVIWGDYGVSPTHVQVSVHFEVLKPPPVFPKLKPEAHGQARTLAIAELNSFKLQTHLSNEMSYLTLFTLGMVQYAQEDWDGAIARFTAALDQVQEPVTTLNQAIVHFYRGACYYFKRDYKKLIADINQALKLKPDLAEAYNNRGTAYYEQKNVPQAIADYTQALTLKPDYAAAYYNRGLAYADQQNYPQAIADYTQALTLKPDYAAAYNNRGTAYDHQNNHTQAIADYTQALKLKPNLAAAYYNRGNAYADQQNYAQAIADYTQALTLKPDYAEAYNSRGLAYNAQNNYPQAFAGYTQALKLKPDYADAYSNRGTAYAEQQNYNQAIADFNQALTLKPDLAVAYYNRGLAYATQQNYTQAIADFNQALTLKPDYAEAYYNKARVYSLENKVNEAIESLQQAINLDAREREAAKTDPNFEHIRQNPQFQALVGR